jgi:hypothetical protein
MDGDGDLDMLVANRTSGGRVSVRLNGGDATGSNTGVFAGGSDILLVNIPGGVAVGDVDGDGDLDMLVVIGTAPGRVSIRLNGGDASGSNTGGFANGTDLTVGNNPSSLAVGDVDGDGDLDLLTANNSSGTVSVRLNGGDSTGSNTGVFAGGSDPAVDAAPQSVVLGDVDGDGDLDLLTANSYNSSGTVSVRLNGGNALGGGTGTFSGGSDPAVGANPYSLAVGDVDGDGDLDLLTANSGSDNVSVRLNGGNATGSNTGVFSGGSEAGVGGYPYSLAVGDVDGDGDLDLLTANPGASFGGTTVSVRFNQPAPTIISFTPTSGPVGQSVIVTGTDLTGASSVTVNGTASTITANTATSLTFTVGAGSTTGVIRITTPAGATSSTASFTVIPTPVITSFSPATGPIGQTVTVSGTNFTGATALTVGGTGVTFTFVNSTTLTFVVAAGSPSGLLAVTTPGGTATSSGSFLFIPPPTVTGVAPSPAASGSTVTITGTNLGGTTGVTVNGTAITGYTVVNGTTITFTVPAGVTSGTVGVTTPGGSTSSSGSLTIDNTPPTAALSTTAGSSTGVAPIPFTVVFSEGVTGFGPTDLTITGGTLTGTVSGTSGGTTYTFSITPTASGSVVTVRVVAGAAQDAANNSNPASNLVSVTYNGPPPAADLINTGTLLTVQAGGILYVGTGGLGNQGGTLTNGGTLRVDGPLSNPATLDLGAGTLEVKGDLTNAGTLTPGTSPVTFSGAADQTFSPGGATLYRVVVNKPTAGANTLRLAGDLTVSNTLTLTSGLVNTKSGTTISTLRLPNGATLTGEASGRYVLGSLAITRNAVSGAAVNFGHGATLDPKTSNLGTVSITRTAGLLTDDVSRGANFANSSLKGIDRIYTVAATTAPSAAVQLTLNWLPDNDNGLTDFSQARVWQQTAAGQPWAVRGPVANANARSISMSPTTLGRFTVSNGANPLPVTLVDFTAQAEGPHAVRLAWATAQEVNNAGFTVERSLDGRTFQAIGTVAGAGTSAVRHDYTLLDAQLPIGPTLLYYRLRQTDLNGDFAYSPVRSVSLTPLAAGLVVYPTRVAAGQSATYLYTGPAQAGTLDILNVLGQVLGSVALDGRASGPVPLAGLAAGIYFVRYTGPAGRFTTRCVID